MRGPVWDYAPQMSLVRRKGRSVQPVVTRRDRKKQAVRLALEDAALRLFDGRGFSATTIDQIADRADVSRSTLFRYFGSKEALLFDAYDDRGRALAEMLQARPQGEAPLVAFENALVEMTKDAQSGGSDRELAALRRRIIESDRSLKVRSDELVRRWGLRIAETLAERDGQPAPQRRHLLAAAVGLAVTERIAQLYVDPSVPQDPETMVRSEFALLRELVAASS